VSGTLATQTTEALSVRTATPEARRFGAAVALQAPIAMREQGIAVGIEEVGRPERAQLGGEFGQN
jgi:hypothetical protein